MRKLILSLPILRNYAKVSALLSLSAIVFFHPNNFAIGTTLALVVLFLGYMEQSYKAIGYSILVGGAFPTLCEMLAVYKGVWAYSNPSVMGVPYWLPLAWGLASFISSKSINRFATRKNKAEFFETSSVEQQAA